MMIDAMTADRGFLSKYLVLFLSRGFCGPATTSYVNFLNLKKMHHENCTENKVSECSERTWTSNAECEEYRKFFNPKFFKDMNENSMKRFLKSVFPNNMLDGFRSSVFYIGPSFRSIDNEVLYSRFMLCISINENKQAELIPMSGLEGKPRSRQAATLSRPENHFYGERDGSR